MVEYVNGWEEFDDDLSGILDFPMESLGEEELDWDFSNLQCLGPIPSNIIMGPSSICGDTIDAGCPRLLPELVAPMNTGQLQQSHHVDASSSHIRQRNKLANNSGAFKTQSPVSVLESNGFSLGGMSLSVKSDNAVPVRTRSRSKPVKHVVDPWLFVSPGFSTSQKTLNAKKSNESKKKSFRLPVAMDFIKDFPENVENPLAVPDHSHLQHASSHRLAVAKKCFHCESTKTLQWREGPTGPKTLCNACGLRYRSGCLFPEYRPANSPSFTPSNHSNSRKKVIEMRNKAKQSACIIKIAEAPERKQLSNHHVVNVGEFGASEAQNIVPVVENRSKMQGIVNLLSMASPGLPTTPKSLNTTGDVVNVGESGAIGAQNLVLVLENRSKMQGIVNLSSMASPGLPTSPKSLNTTSEDANHHVVNVGESGAIEAQNLVPVLENRSKMQGIVNLSSMASPGLPTSPKSLNTTSDVVNVGVSGVIEAQNLVPVLENRSKMQGIVNLSPMASPGLPTSPKSLNITSEDANHHVVNVRESGAIEAQNLVPVLENRSRIQATVNLSPMVSPGLPTSPKSLNTTSEDAIHHVVNVGESSGIEAQNLVPVLENGSKKQGIVASPGLPTSPKSLNTTIEDANHHVVNVGESGAIEAQNLVPVLENRSEMQGIVASPGLPTSPKSLNTTSEDALPELQKLSNHAGVSTSRIHLQNKLSSDSVLESRGSILGGKSLPMKPDITIPVRIRKRVRPSRFNESLLERPGPSSS